MRLEVGSTVVRQVAVSCSACSSHLDIPVTFTIEAVEGPTFLASGQVTNADRLWARLFAGAHRGPFVLQEVERVADQ